MTSFRDTDFYKEAEMKIGERRATEYSRHQRALTVLNKAESDMSECIASYMMNGVFFMDRDTIQLLADHMEIKVRGHMQDLARSMGRPYVRAEKWESYVNYPSPGTADVIELKVPNTKRLQNVVAPLILGATKTDYFGKAMGMFAKDGKVLFLNETPGTWEFWMVGKTGQKLFDDFVNRCATDPVCRLVMKL